VPGLPQHQRDFPDYKYQPMRKEDKVKMKEARDREKALARKERALDKAMRESLVEFVVRADCSILCPLLLDAMIAPRKSRAKPKAVPQPPSLSPSPEPSPAVAPAPHVQPVFDTTTYRDPTLAVPKQTALTRSPKKTAKKPRKNVASAKSKRLHVVTDPRDCGVMDGAQVFWAGPPDLRESESSAI